MNDDAPVLIIDDDALVRGTFRRVLERTGSLVLEAESGQAGLILCRERKPGVVLLDLRMPGMDGMSVLKMIKQKWPDTEVVIITGYPTVETAKEAVRLGAYDYLAKPVGPDDVINVANGAMTQKKWALHKDRTGQNDGIGSNTASSLKTSSFAN